MLSLSINPTDDDRRAAGLAPDVRMPGKESDWAESAPKLDVSRAKAISGVEKPPDVVVPTKAMPAYRGATVFDSANMIAAAMALAIHVLLVVALAYAPRTPGGMDREAIEAIDVEIVAEPDMSAAPAPAQDIFVAVDLPPPLPDPVVEVARTPDAQPEPGPMIAERQPEPEPEKPPDPPPAAKPAETPRPEAPVAAAQNVQPREGRAERQGGASTRGENPAAIDAFKRAVAVKIARSKPAGALARAAQGTVMLSFEIAASGAATDVRIIRSSGSNTLDEAALATLRRASPFQPPPAGAPRSFVVPISFRAR